MSEDHLNARFDAIEQLVKANALLAKRAAVEAAAKVVAEAHQAAADVKHDLSLELAHERKQLAHLQRTVTSILESVTVLQRNSLRVLGASSLGCGILIFVLSRALGI